MSLRKSFAYTFGTRYAELTLSFIASLVLARLLSPEDFGIYGIAASVAGLGYLFRNFGIGQLIIQAEQLDDELIRAAFGLTLSISWGIGILLLVGSPAIGGYYDDDRVTRVLMFLSINFFLLPFGAITDAVLRRRMQFDKLAAIGIAAAVAGPAVGIVSAVLGAKYMSIVWGANALTLATLVMTLVYRPKGLPWRPSFKGMRRVLSFGTKVGLTDLLNKGSDAATELVVGKVHGMYDLGIYSRAFGAFMMFEYLIIIGFRPAILPYLSQANRERTPLGPVYLLIIRFMSVCMLPFFVFMYLNAADFMLVLYGDQWTASVPLVQLLCLAGILLAPTVFFEQLLIARGLPGYALSYQMAFQGFRLGILMMLISGDLAAAAWAYIAGSTAQMLLVLGIARAKFAIELVQIGRALLPSLLVATGVGIGLLLLGEMTHSWSSEYLRLASASACAGLLWLGLVYLIRHPIAEEISKLAANLAGLAHRRR